MRYLFETDSIDNTVIKAIEFSNQVWDEDRKTFERVTVEHQDGTSFNFREAHIRYAQWRAGDLVIVYPEHHHPMVFDISSLERVRVVERVMITTDIIYDEILCDALENARPDILRQEGQLA
ncbi:MAG: hypothetical protein JWQ09_1827 [Segetibacter sp.]|nr:hypothetical protein [Segetibacter sp.]